jgi:MscS family membrane protein
MKKGFENGGLDLEIRRSIGVIVLICLVIGIAQLPSDADGKKVDNFKALVDLYDPSMEKYSGLNDLDTVTFRDKVSISNYHEDPKTGIGMTHVWLESTRGSWGSPTLVFPGDETYRLLREAEVDFTVIIVEKNEGNRTYQEIEAFSSGIKIIEEGETEDKILHKDKIDVLGFVIHKEDLPDYLQSDWARFGIALGLWSAAIVVIWFVFRLLLLFTKKTKTNLDSQIVKIVRIPFFLILFVYGLLVSLSQLELPDEILNGIDLFYRAGVIILVAIIAIKLFKKVIMVYLKLISEKTETQADDVLVPVVGKVVTVVIWLFAFIMFMNNFGVDITVFIGAMGIAGLVIAFAAQDTLSNFFAGIMILLDRPFKEDDWIILDDSVYQVKHIGLRSTRLFSSWTQQVVTLPNNKIASYMFSNLSEPDAYGRRTLKFGVSYDTDIEKMKKVVHEIVSAQPGVVVDKDHSILVRFNDFGDSALNWGVTFFVRDYNDQWAIASDIRHEMYHRFAKEGIEVPFPQRVIHMEGGIPGTMRPPHHGGKDPSEMSNLSP